MHAQGCLSCAKADWVVKIMKGSVHHHRARIGWGGNLGWTWGRPIFGSSFLHDANPVTPTFLINSITIHQDASFTSPKSNMEPEKLVWKMLMLLMSNLMSGFQSHRPAVPTSIDVHLASEKKRWDDEPKRTIWDGADVIRLRWGNCEIGTVDKMIIKWG